MPKTSKHENNSYIQQFEQREESVLGDFFELQVRLASCLEELQPYEKEINVILQSFDDLSDRIMKM